MRKQCGPKSYNINKHNKKSILTDPILESITIKNETKYYFSYGKFRVRAAGLAFICNYPGKNGIYGMMIKEGIFNNNKNNETVFSNSGGAVERGDADPLYTVMREFKEEVIDIYEQIKNNNVNSTNNYTNANNIISTEQLKNITKDLRNILINDSEKYIMPGKGENHLSVLYYIVNVNNINNRNMKQFIRELFNKKILFGIKLENTIPVKVTYDENCSNDVNNKQYNGDINVHPNGTIKVRSREGPLINYLIRQHDEYNKIQKLVVQ